MRVTAIRSIRAFCVECIGGAAYVEDCTAIKCQLYPFRMGRNPNYSEAARERAREKFRQKSPFISQKRELPSGNDLSKLDTKTGVTSVSQRKK